MYHSFLTYDQLRPHALMYTRSADVSVIGLLRQCYSRPHCQARRVSISNTRKVSTQASVKWRHVPRTGSYALNASGGRSKKVCNRNFHSTAAIWQKDTSSKDSKNDIAVLGGGITGLSTAYYLSREFPTANITLYEGSDRLGGWLRSTPVEVEGGRVVFESGPRTLRSGTPSALATLEIVIILSWLPGSS